MRKYLTMLLVVCMLLIVPVLGEETEPEDIILEEGDVVVEAAEPSIEDVVSEEVEPSMDEVTFDLGGEEALPLLEEESIAKGLTEESSANDEYGLTINGFHIPQEQIGENLTGEGWTWEGYERRLTLSGDFDEIIFSDPVTSRELYLVALEGARIGRVTSEKLGVGGDLAIRELKCGTLDVGGHLVVGANSEAELLAETDYSGYDGRWANSIYFNYTGDLVFANCTGAYFHFTGGCKMLSLGEITGAAVEMTGGTFEARGGVDVSFFLQNDGDSVLSRIRATNYILVNNGTMTVENHEAGVSGVTTGKLEIRAKGNVALRDADDALEIDTLVRARKSGVIYEALYGVHELVVENAEIKAIDGWHGTSEPIVVGEERLDSYVLENLDVRHDTWSWDHTSQTLTLNGYKYSDYSNGSITMERFATVALADGSENNCGIFAKKGLTLTGSGTLSSDLLAHERLEINQCILADVRITVLNGPLTIRDSVVNAPHGMDVSGPGNDIDIQSSDVFCGSVVCTNMNIRDSQVMMSGEVHGKLTASSCLLFDNGLEVRKGKSIDKATAQFAFDGSTFKLINNATLNRSYFVPDIPISIPKGKKLTIKEGCTLYLTGSLNKKGKISGNYVVVRMPTALQVTGSESMVVGGSQQLQLSLTPKDATPDVLWISSDETLANVDQNGKVTITKAAASHVGEQVSIGAISTINPDCYDEFIITIAPGTESITIQQNGKEVKSLELWLDPANKEAKLRAAVYPHNAPKNVIWKTDKPKIIAVGSDGNLSAKKYGTAMVWAEATDGTGVASNKINVTVLKAPSSVKVTKKLSLSYDPIKGEGTSGNLNPVLSKGSASTLTYSGYDASVVKVDENGIVTAVGAGSTKITVKTYNKKKATCTVTVTNPYAPTGVKLDRQGTIKLKVGETVQLNAELIPITAVDTVKWTSSKASVATVEDGLVTAVKKGSAKITVTTSNGKKAKVKVKVS